MQTNNSAKDNQFEGNNEAQQKSFAQKIHISGYRNPLTGNRTIRPKKYDSAWPNNKQRIVAAFLSFLFGQGRIVWVEKYIELYNSANALCFMFFIRPKMVCN